MKKTLCIFAAILIAAVSAYAALDAYDTMTVKTISALKVCAGIQTNAAVDVSGAKGICNLIVMVGPGTNAITATLKHSASSGGTYLPVTNGAAAEMVFTCPQSATTGTVYSVKLEAEKLLRYLKLYTTEVGDGTSAAGAYLIYPK